MGYSPNEVKMTERTRPAAKESEAHGITYEIGGKKTKVPLLTYSHPRETLITPQRDGTSIVAWKAEKNEH